MANNIYIFHLFTLLYMDVSFAHNLFTLYIISIRVKLVYIILQKKQQQKLNTKTRRHKGIKKNEVFFSCFFILECKTRNKTQKAFC